MALVAPLIAGPELFAPSRIVQSPPDPALELAIQVQHVQRPVIVDVHEGQMTPDTSVVKFRWNRTYLTHSDHVLLEGDFLEGKPFTLRWNDRLELYESEPTKVPCDHHICLLRINGDLLLLDSFEVNCYTFEVNLSLREEFDVTPEPECLEVIEDHIQAKASSLSLSSAQSNISMDDRDSQEDETPRSGSGSINLSRRYEDLVQKQMRLSGHESDSSERNTSQHVNGSYEEGHRFRELEDTLISLKHTLDDKESEIRDLHSDVSDLRTENRLLNNQLRDTESHRGGNSNGDDSYNRLLAEKENLATELYKMRNQMNQNGRGSRDSQSIDCYDPDNPEVLKEKLADLQGQVQDLHEASESASAELNRAERKIKELSNENDTLQTLGGVSVEDIQAENQYLRQQVERLNERNSKLLNDSDSRERDEMQAARSDLRTLRDRNQQVNEENLRLREELRTLRQRSDESLRRLRHTAPSPKFHDTSLVNSSGGYRNGLDDTIGRYNRSSLDDFVPGYSGYPSPPRSSSKISDQLSGTEEPKDYSTLHTYSPPTQDCHKSISPKYSPPIRADHNVGRTYCRKDYDDEMEKYNPLLTDRSDSTAYLTSNIHTNAYDVDNNLSDNEVAEMTDVYLRPTRSKSPRPSEQYNPLPPSKSRHKAAPSYYVDDVSPSRKHRYSNHFDDDTSSTSSILSEVERELLLISGGSSAQRQRSRSFEPKKSRGSASQRDNRMLSPVGFRSCSPPPTVTQSNKAALGNPTKKSILSTTGKRPFAPRSPGDIGVGAVVKFSRQNGQISKGLVRYIGNLPGRNDSYLGLELENEAGKHDGMYNNQRYFTCKPNKGVFVTFNKIVMCWM